jgi:hypothetical protein
MSLTDIHIQLGVSSANLTVTKPDIKVVAAGNLGPRGPAGKWEALTQNEYDLLNPPDPDTLYVIIQ